MIRKWLAVGIILLFVGVTIAPTINFQVVKASSNDDLVEVTTQACGIKGYRDSTVKLTREQYQNLKEYLVEFRARLNQTSTREEAVPIFKDAVVELDKYGLLPRGMSVEQAQKLVIGGYQNFQDRDILNKCYNINKRTLDANTNILCLYAGQTDNTFVISFMLRLLLIPLIILVSIQEFFSDLPIFYAFSTVLFQLLGFILTSSPIGFNQWISYGHLDAFPFGEFIPARGWVYTNGLNGIKTWEDSFGGGFDGSLFHFGTFGFTGISLVLPLKGERYCLGTALIVKLTGS
jgi:hypothetical protein